MRLLGDVSDIISIASTNYTMLMPTTTGPNTQVITMSSSGLMSPENWIQNQWYTVVVYNLTPKTYTAASFSVQADLDMDNSDVQDPVMSVAASGVNNKSLIIVATVLPVKLGEFTVIEEKGNAVLDWNTYLEVNNKGFEIERSYDAKNFVNIGWVDGQGTSNRETEYIFIDKSPLQQIQYYRLKQVDFDEKYEYSDIKSLSMYNVKSDLYIYPNPLSQNGVLYIGGAGSNNMNVDIYDLKGKLVKSYKNINGDINCVDIESGVYMVRFNENDIIKNIKLLIL
jgi:hypothetical protein